MNSLGSPLGDPFQVNTYAAGDQESAAVAANPSGNMVVVWVSESQEPSGSGIYGQRFDSGVMPVGTEFHPLPRLRSRDSTRGFWARTGDGRRPIRSSSRGAG